MPHACILVFFVNDFIYEKNNSINRIFDSSERLSKIGTGSRCYVVLLSIGLFFAYIDVRPEARERIPAHACIRSASGANSAQSPDLALQPAGVHSRVRMGGLHAAYP